MRTHWLVPGAFRIGSHHASAKLTRSGDRSLRGMWLQATRVSEPRQEGVITRLCQVTKTLRVSPGDSVSEGTEPWRGSTALSGSFYFPVNDPKPQMSGEVYLIFMPDFYASLLHVTCFLFHE